VSEQEDRGPAKALGGEHELPLEHTQRVRARKVEAPSQLTVHDPPEPPPRSSTELSERARRQRRQERDRRAERRAIGVVVMGLVLLGGGALVAVNVLMDDPPPSPPAPVDPAAQAALTPPRPRGVISTPIEETPDLPVLRFLRQDGLTVGAEGLPEVVADSASSDVAPRAAVESCRFSYGVWEFSPNKRFRFLTTCEALKGQILVGAYEVEGAKLRMSPLAAQEVLLVTEMTLEKPSEARTVVLRAGDQAPILEVRQRLTAMRPGLEGEAFRDAFEPRNTIAPRGAAPAPAPPPPAVAPPPAEAPRDPVLEMLQGGGQ
jgi:hypothetical protein